MKVWKNCFFIKIVRYKEIYQAEIANFSIDGYVEGGFLLSFFKLNYVYLLMHNNRENLLFCYKKNIIYVEKLLF